MHVGQAEITTRVVISQPLVIEAQAMQDCRMQVMHVGWFVDDVKTKLVGRTERLARFDAAAGVPSRVPPPGG